MLFLCEVKKRKALPKKKDRGDCGQEEASSESEDESPMWLEKKKWGRAEKRIKLGPNPKFSELSSDNAGDLDIISRFRFRFSPT